MTELDVNLDSSVYYQGGYWNDLDAVVSRINEWISGDPHRSWHEHFGFASGRTFERALILNCGNGWVERELLGTGLVGEAVGIDCSASLLADARAAAADQGLPLRYVEMNVNTDELPAGPFDLVVNHAAAHHIAAIDGVFRRLCRLLPEDGWFVSFDYVGPHRNQYTAEAWEAAWELNLRLPEDIRQDLAYPHLPTMLVTDPTEAIHSELIVETFRRYFVEHEFVPLGGALAYPLLTHNRRLFETTDEVARAEWVDRILEADADFLRTHPESSLFAYFSGTPNKSVLEETRQLERWQTDEEARERRAAENGGEYSTRGSLASSLIALDALHWEHVRVRGRVTELEAEVERLQDDPLYAACRRVMDAAAIRRLRATSLVNALERRVRAVARRP
jgi:SAM-dependent methyltransferase